MTNAAKKLAEPANDVVVDEAVGARDRAEGARPLVAPQQLALLVAKAAVCDAYREWLETPRPRQRWKVSAALLTLSEFERSVGRVRSKP